MQDILSKMNSIFGETDTEPDVLASFFGARQAKTESVADWRCRLEALVDLAKRQSTLPGDSDLLLRNMLWSGLRQDLKDVSLYHYDKSTSFDQLRIELRRIEKQHAQSAKEPAPKSPAACKAAQRQAGQKEVDQATQLQQVITHLAKLDARFDKLEKAQESQKIDR